MGNWPEGPIFRMEDGFCGFKMQPVAPREEYGFRAFGNRASRTIFAPK
jgi:hypothetical protein